MALVVVVVAGMIRAAVGNGLHDGEGSGFKYGPDETASGVQETATNPLVTAPGSPLSPAQCPYTPWGTEVDTARAFFAGAADCLAAAWKPAFEAAGLDFVAPELSVSASTEGITTPCSGSSSNFAAFYCGANQTIYMPISQLQTDIFGTHWEVYLSVFAHEYGHHIQALSGILSAANKERGRTGRYSDTGLELSRRIELQANCFDGMYFASSTGGRSLTPIQAQNARTDAYGRGDTAGDMRSHGTTENAGNWWSAGFDQNLTVQCNTFTAPSGQVN
ncbi:neutral zinc metallopeptidase [Nocardia vermiculata]|uniref:neutral zinc metallopeptidase n=1 Tax=Nocardia vermiculata TaxID=257274 RepID=UPI0012EE7CD9|nr:neutral zinc metallopeptidase [Nocardia vermiculata]